MEHKLLPVQTKYVDRHRSRLSASAKLTSSHASSASVEFLLETLNALPQHIAVLDEKGVIIAVNDSWKRFAKENGWGDSNFGIGTNYLKTCTVRSRSDSSLVKQVKTGITAVLKGERSSLQLDYPCHSPAEKRWFTMHVTRFTQNRKPYIVVSHENITHLKITADRAAQLARDITKRKQVEQALEKSELTNRMLVQSINEGVMMQTTEGKVISYNQQAKHIFGLTDDHLQGKALPPANWYAVKPDETKYDERDTTAMDTLRSGKAIKDLVLGIHKPNGQVTWISANAQPIYLHDKKHPDAIVTSFSDITERRKSEESMQHLTEQLQRSNRELQDFASVASHDLQEPLRKVQAFGDRLQVKYAEELTEEGQDYLSRMQNAASRMQTLINDLLQFSRVTTKAQPFEAVDLQKITQDVLSDLEIRIEQHHAKVVADNLPTISADPMQMRQLFQNLIGNSLKFIEKNRKPKIVITSKRIKVHLKKKSSTEMLEIRFKDNGIGFDEKYLDRIFNVFQRLHGQQEYSGTGVGLAVCRKIVERHHGTITAKSKEGKGTTFIVNVPIKQKSE